MAFQKSWIEEKLIAARSADRLAHAYLLTGPQLEPLEEMAQAIARLLLETDAASHPDLHILRPESKSRRITIGQVRALEHELRLKAFQAPRKVAIISSADRMCIGSAEPANAFLKTLEEPPEHTTLLLLTDRPDQILPTIRSRCLNLPLAADPSNAPAVTHDAFVQDWIQAPGQSVERAYRRAAITLLYWKSIRDSLKKELKASQKSDEPNPEEEEARIEARFHLQRDESIAALIRTLWGMTTPASMERASRICHLLEEMRYAIQRNVDPALSVERCHIAMETRRC